MFDLGWALGVRCDLGNESRHIYNLLQEILVAEEFNFGIEFFFRNVGTGEIHGAGGLGGDYGVKAAPAQQNLEVRFISRREEREEHRCQQDERKRSSRESRTPEQRGRKFAGGWGKGGARVSGQFRGHGSYSERSVPARLMGARQIWETKVNAATPFC